MMLMTQPGVVALQMCWPKGRPGALCSSCGARSEGALLALEVGSGARRNMGMWGELHRFHVSDVLAFLGLLCGPRTGRGQARWLHYSNSARPGHRRGPPGFLLCSFLLPSSPQHG